jgi:hypothetical protein
VLGNAKSGTTAIAALLASATGLSRTLDLPRFTVAEQDALHAGELPLSDFVSRHAAEFSRALVKEPALTFLLDRLVEHFPLQRGVFIVRDPRDNLRSILDRVGLPGDLRETPPPDGLSDSWRRVLDNRWLGLEAPHYVDSLAARWNRAIDLYRRHAGRLLLLRYEEFLLDKRGAVERLAADLGLPVVHDVSREVDVAYQPPGDASVSWASFFGDNLARIEDTCGERARALGYPVPPHARRDDGGTP